MSHLYTHFVHIHYDTILPMPPGRDLLSLPLTATSGTAKLQAGPIGSMQGFDRQLLLNTRQSVGWTLRRPVRLHGRYPGSLGADPDEAQAATTTLRIYCYRLHINQLRLFQYWTRLGRCREGVMNDVLCGSIWLILVRAFWEYFMFLAIAKVGKFADPTHRGNQVLHRPVLAKTTIYFSQNSIIIAIIDNHSPSRRAVTCLSATHGNPCNHSLTRGH